MWFIGVEAEQEASAPPPKKNPGSAPGQVYKFVFCLYPDSFIGIKFRLYLFKV